MVDASDEEGHKQIGKGVSGKMKARVELEQMGKRILGIVRTELYLSMRFMGSALNSLGFCMDLSTRTVGTDAAFIRFHPNYLLQLYVERPEILNRTYMHLLLHCIFRHMFSAKEHEDRELWDLCCDIAVESVVDSMDYPSILRVTSDFREQWYEKLNAEVGVLTAEKLYHYFILQKRDPYMEESLRQEFALCDHSFWERMQEPKQKEQSPADILPPQEQPSGMADEKESSRPEQEIPKSVAPLGQTNPKEEEWKENAKRMERELLSHGSEASADSGSLLRFLRIAGKKRTGYQEFLKKFAVIREEVSVDLDSFDYGFYMYGLSLYDNMPLIEENEFREAIKTEELVIAIDTSASCQKKLVQQFLNETGAILKHQESFFHKVCIHIIECDDRVQQDIVIQKPEDLEQYAENFAVKGGYGTDFRPVFSYVEQLQKKGELRHLKGLMYFTDGFGTYPVKPTPYETAFVFWQEEELEDTDVPDWAIKLYLTGDGSTISR